MPSRACVWGARTVTAHRGGPGLPDGLGTWSGRPLMRWSAGEQTGRSRGPRAASGLAHREGKSHLAARCTALLGSSPGRQSGGL